MELRMASHFCRLQTHRICSNLFAFRRSTGRNIDEICTDRKVTHFRIRSVVVEQERTVFDGPTEESTRTSTSRFTKNREKPTNLVQKITLCLEKSLEKTEYLLEYAADGQGTIYFDKDMKDAKASLNDSLLQYNNLLMNAEPAEKNDNIYNFGRKIKELVAFKELLKKQNSNEVPPTKPSNLERQK